MPATRNRPKAVLVTMSQRRVILIDYIARRVTPESTDGQIDGEIRLFMFGSSSYGQRMASRYYVSSIAMQTTKLSDTQLKRLYRDIRKEAKS